MNLYIILFVGLLLFLNFFARYRRKHKIGLVRIGGFDLDRILVYALLIFSLINLVIVDRREYDIRKLSQKGEEPRPSLNQDLGEKFYQSSLAIDRDSFRIVDARISGKKAYLLCGYSLDSREEVRLAILDRNIFGNMKLASQVEDLPLVTEDYIYLLENDDYFTRSLVTVGYAPRGDNLGSYILDGFRLEDVQVQGYFIFMNLAEKTQPTYVYILVLMGLWIYRDLSKSREQGKSLYRKTKKFIELE